MIKTYDWMKATASSIINSIVWGKSINLDMSIHLNLSPIKPKSKCPATILAANRIDRVRGRIITLTDSTKTIRGIKISGVPWGIRLWSREDGVSNQDKTIKLTQNKNANLIGVVIKDLGVNT